LTVKTIKKDKDAASKQRDSRIFKKVIAAFLFLNPAKIKIKIQGRA
jgi:hypothetical protein